MRAFVEPQVGESVLFYDYNDLTLKSVGTIKYVSSWEGSHKVWFSDYDEDYEYLNDHDWSEQKQAWILDSENV